MYDRVYPLLGYVPAHAITKDPSRAQEVITGRRGTGIPILGDEGYNYCTTSVAIILVTLGDDEH